MAPIVWFFTNGKQSVSLQFEIITAVVWFWDILLIWVMSFGVHGPHFGFWYAWMVPTFHLVPWLAAVFIWRDTAGANSSIEIIVNARKRAMLVVLMRWVYIALIVIEWTFLDYYR